VFRVISRFLFRFQKFKFAANIAHSLFHEKEFLVLIRVQESAPGCAATLPYSELCRHK
jgi:hypothetical protein